VAYFSLISCGEWFSLPAYFSFLCSLHLKNNSDNGGSGRGVTSRAAGFRRARRRPDCMADPLDLVSTSLLFLFFDVRWVFWASVSNSREPFLIAR